MLYIPNLVDHVRAIFMHRHKSCSIDLSGSNVSYPVVAVLRERNVFLLSILRYHCTALKYLGQATRIVHNNETYWTRVLGYSLVHASTSDASCVSTCGV